MNELIIVSICSYSFFVMIETRREIGQYEGGRQESRSSIKARISEFLTNQLDRHKLTLATHQIHGGLVQQSEDSECCSRVLCI